MSYNLPFGLYVNIQDIQINIAHASKNYLLDSKLHVYLGLVRRTIQLAPATIDGKHKYTFGDYEQLHIFSVRTLALECEAKDVRRSPLPWKEHNGVLCRGEWRSHDILEELNAKKTWTSWQLGVRKKSRILKMRGEDNSIILNVVMTFTFSYLGKDVLPGTSKSAQALPITPIYSDLSVFSDILKDILGSLTAEVMDLMKNIHPAAHLIILAFQLAIKYCKNKQKFSDRFKALMKQAGESLHDLKDTAYVIKESEDDTGASSIVNIMERILETADYAKSLERSGLSARIIEEQFGMQLTDLETAFDECTNDLRRVLKRVKHRKELLGRIGGNLRLGPDGQTFDRPYHPQAERRRAPLSRISILDDLDQLFKKDHRVVWITGAPGAGKTTVVDALRDMHAKAGDHVASFFFTDNGDDEVVRLWPTIAYQIALPSSSVRESLSSNLDGPCTTILQDQFKQLIERPLRSRTDTQRLIVIVDGLDRAALSSRSIKDYIDLLEAFEKWPKATPSNCTLVISSRVIYSIQKYLTDARRMDLTEYIKHSDDIPRYLQAELRRLRKNTYDQQLQGAHGWNWPESRDLERLVTIADGSFLWAEAAVEFIGQGGDKDQRLDTLLSGSSIPIRLDLPLYGLYHRAVDRTISSMLDGEVLRVTGLLGALVVFMAPPSFDQLIQLQILPPEITLSNSTRTFQLSDLSKGLGPLLPFVRWDKGGENMRLSHQSFRAFLLSNKGLLKLRIEEQHAKVACQVLRWLNTTLRFNLGGVPSSHIAIQNYDSPEPLDSSGLFDYASRYLITHLRCVNFKDGSTPVYTEIVRQLEIFAYQHFLHWLEVSSYLNIVSRIPTMLDALGSWLCSNFATKLDLIRFMQDAKDFCETFSVPISFNPAHIYISALPFVSPRSEVYKRFKIAFPNVLQLDRRKTTKFSEGPASDESMIAVGFSGDGDTVFSGSSIGCVYRWEARTGRQLGHWRLETGKRVSAMAFSPGAKYVALILQSKAYAVYDLRVLQHGKDLKTAKVDCKQWVNDSNKVATCLAFFPTDDGERLAFGFCDGTNPDGSLISSVRIVNVTSRRQTALQPCTTKTAINSLAISPNGTYLMGRTSKNTLIAFCPSTVPRLFHSACNREETPLWNVETTRTISPRKQGPFKLAMKLRRQEKEGTGKSIANGKAERVAYIEGEDHTNRILLTHNTPSALVAVSPPVFGVCRVAVADANNTIHVWNIGTGVVELILPTHTLDRTGDDKMLSFSSDGRYLVSANSNGDIVIWDLSSRDPHCTGSAFRPVRFGRNGRVDEPLKSSNDARNLRMRRSGRKGDSSSDQALFGCMNKESAICIDDHSYISSDRWVHDKFGNHLYWVPPDSEKGLWWPRMISVNDVLSHRMTTIDFGRFVHGTEWARCCEAPL